MKNQQAIIILFIANTVSGIAQGISMIAIPWYYTVILGEPVAFGWWYFLITALMLLWVPYAGVIIDKYDRKHVSMVVNGIGGTFVLGCAAYGFYTGNVPSILAAGVFGFTFANYSIHYPNLYAFAQEISESKHYGRITSWLEVQGQFSNALAGGLATILLSGIQNGQIELFGYPFQTTWNFEAWSLQEVFLLDGSTYMLALLLIGFIRYRRVAVRHFEKGSIKERIRVGLDFLKEHPMIYLFGLASYVVFVTVLAVNFFILPVFVDQHLGGEEGVYASAEFFFAAISLVAGMLVNNLFERIGSVNGIIILSLVAAGIFVLNIMNTYILVFLISYGFYGFCNAGIRVLRVTWLFHHVPNQVVGRVNSVFRLFNVVGRLFFIGLFSIPFFTAPGGVEYAFGILVLFILVGVVFLSHYRKALQADNL